MSAQQNPKKRVYPRRQKPEERLILCIHCSGNNCIKGGKHPTSGKQQYRCKDCNRVFTPVVAQLFGINPEDEYQKQIWDGYKSEDCFSHHPC